MTEALPCLPSRRSCQPNPSGPQRSSASLLITEATSISEQALGWTESPGIYTAEMIEGWKPTVRAVHQKGGLIFLQLWHCGRASHSSFHDGEPAVAPSALEINEEYIHTPIGKQPHEVPRALDTTEIPRIVVDYRTAAQNAKAAGFDGIEIHAANGYLIDTFLQSTTNHRTDVYGGTIENRGRFLKEVVEAVTSVWPATEYAGAPGGISSDVCRTTPKLADIRDNPVPFAGGIRRDATAERLTGLLFGVFRSVDDRMEWSHRRREEGMSPLKTVDGWRAIWTGLVAGEAFVIMPKYGCR